MPTDFERQYEAGRDVLAAAHDKGAGDALREAVRDNASVDCMAYCYGGSPTLELRDVLADLAEAGWRLTQEEE